MATDNNIKKFTATDIEKYHRGLLSAKERHDLEKAALDDPFLADALEGYAVTGTNTGADIADLKKRITERVEGAKVVSIHTARKTLSPFLRAAAMIVVLIGAGYLVYQFAFNKKKDEVAQNKPASAEEIKQAVTDTNTAKTSSDNKAPGIVTVPGDKMKTKDSQQGRAGNTGEIKTTEGNVTSTLAAGEKTGEYDNAVADSKTSPAGGATLPAVTVPAKPDEISTGVKKQRELEAEKEIAREETKTKAPAAKKQMADKDVSRGNADIQQPDDSRNKKEVALNRQADDNYYRNQAMNTFRGKVTDASNTGLPFANVTNVRDNVGTYTDANGNFILTSPDSILTVQVRSVGYDNNNVQLRNDLTSNKVVMQEDRKNLSEIVISNQKPNTAARSKDANRKLIEPEPADGWEKYDSYLANNLNIPKDFSPQKTNDNNSVQVSFEVDKNGEPVNIRIEKSLCPKCDDEAKRLIKDGPKWKRNANKKGRTTVTINF